jgi:hypothetical protein
VAYSVHWTPGASKKQHPANFDFVVRAGEENAIHVSMILYDRDGGGVGVMVIDAAGRAFASAAAPGAALARDEVVGTPLAAPLFALFDAVWLGGNSASPAITGLAGAVAAGNTITVGASAATTLANLADVVGKVDETVMGTSSWVVSRAGYVDLMKIWSAQQTTMTVGGGRVVPTVFGAPVFLVKGLPSTTLALYGDFAMSTVLGVKDSGLEIEAGREILMRNRQVLFCANTRFGAANHAPEFVGRLAKAAS